MTESWTDLAKQLGEALTDDPSDRPTFEGEVDMDVGGAEFDILIESTGADPRASGSDTTFSVTCSRRVSNRERTRSWDAC